MRRYRRLQSIGSLVLGIALLAACQVASESSRQPDPTGGGPEPILDEDVGPPAVTVSVPSGPHVIRVSLEDDPGHLVASSPSGSIFVFEPGLHREATIEARDGDRFVGEEGAILSGASELETFEQQGELWVVSDQTHQGETRGECEQGYEGCIFPEQLFIDDEPLWQVTTIDEVQEGTWYFDYAADKFYFADDPTDRTVEISVSRFAIFGSAEDVTIQNLTIEKYANPAQFGAIHGVADPGALGTRWSIEGNVIRYNHGSGLRLGRQMTVRGNVIHHNGHIGMNGTGSDIVVENNEIAYNQTGGFLAFGWVGGGAKFIDTEGLQVLENYVHHNDGHGLHTDHNNIDTLYRGNIVEGNAGVGISHEISYAATIVDNRISGNGFGRSQGVLGAGIMINTSSDVEIRGNELTGNADGIIGQHADRGEGDRGRWELRNLRVDSNLVELTDGSHGVTAGLDHEGVFSEWDNRFSRNTYRFGPGAHFVWQGGELDFAGWQGVGQDVEGIFEEISNG